MQRGHEFEGLRKLRDSARHFVEQVVCRSENRACAAERLLYAVRGGWGGSEGGVWGIGA